MKILVIADANITIPPKDYGGTERIAALICEGLKKQNHTVNLIGKKGSNSYCGKNFYHKTPTKNKFSRIYRKILFQLILMRASKGCDAVINLGRVDYLWFLFRSKIPLIGRFANPIAEYEIDLYNNASNPNIQLIGISNHQINLTKAPALFKVIYNAIDLEKYSFHNINSKKDQYLAFLGRLTYNKGIDTAISVAKKTGWKLKIAGNISNEPGGKEFFEKEVRPHLSEQIEWIGTVNDEQKNTFLGEATATLFPIRWPEPFGIVMIESLACGTPVIATKEASVPEVIKDKQTGFVCDNEEEIIEAVMSISQIKRENCRKEATERFSINVMINNYLNVIKSLKK